MAVSLPMLGISPGERSRIRRATVHTYDGEAGFIAEKLDVTEQMTEDYRQFVLLACTRV